MTLDHGRFVEVLSYDWIEQGALSGSGEKVGVVLRLHVGVQLKNMMAREFEWTVPAGAQCVGELGLDDDSTTGRSRIVSVFIIGRYCMSPGVSFTIGHRWCTSPGCTRQGARKDAR